MKYKEGEVMLKIRKEIYIMVIQLIIFWLFQIIVRCTGEMYGVLLVLLIVYPISVLVLSIAISWTESKLKYLYPFYVLIIYMPIAYIFLYNSTYQYGLVYCGISALGMIIGLVSNYISEFFTKEKGKNKN